MSDQPPVRQPDEIFCHNCGSLIKSDSRFCPNCGTALVAPDAAVALEEGFPPYPVRFDVEYPERLSRLSTAFRLILAIPQLLVVYALGTVVAVVTLIAFFAILFTRRYPKGLFDLVVGFNRWSANVGVYQGLLRDEYPPFATEPDKYPVTYDVAYPEKVNRWLPLVKWWLAMGHQIVLLFLGIVAAVFYFLAWFAILFTGRYPRTFFYFNAGVMRWQLRVNAYTGLLRDEFPPFSKRADARPASGRAIVLSVLFAIVVGIASAAALTAFATMVSRTTHEVPVRYESLLAGTPTDEVDVSGTDVIVLEAEDPAPGSPNQGARLVAFTLRITNRDSLFTAVSDDTFELKDSLGRDHKPDFVEARSPGVRSILERGDSVVVTVAFEIGANTDPAELTYSPRFVELFGTRVRFIFQ